MCSWIPGKIEKLSLSFCLSVSLGLSRSLSVSISFFCLSVRLSFVRPSVFLSFFFSSRISRLNGKCIIFLVPEIHDEDGNFFIVPEIVGEKCLGTFFTRI